MVHRITHWLWTLLALSMLVACGGANSLSGAAPTASPAIDVLASPTIARAPTAAPAPAATQLAPTAAAPQPPAATGEPALAEGVTPEGYHTLGRADAPITLVMYSDFL